MKPSEFMDEMINKRKMTANWAYWDLRPKADEEPSEDAVSASNAPEDEHESLPSLCSW